VARKPVEQKKEEPMQIDTQQEEMIKPSQNNSNFDEQPIGGGR